MFSGLRSSVSHSSRAMKFTRILPAGFFARRPRFCFVLLSSFSLLSRLVGGLFTPAVLSCRHLQEVKADGISSSFPPLFSSDYAKTRAAFFFPFFRLSCFLPREEKCVLSTATRTSDWNKISKPVCHQRCVRFTDRTVVS